MQHLIYGDQDQNLELEHLQKKIEDLSQDDMEEILKSFYKGIKENMTSAELRWNHELE